MSPHIFSVVIRLAATSLVAAGAGVGLWFALFIAASMSVTSPAGSEAKMRVVRSMRDVLGSPLGAARGARSSSR
jgi:hypothetical protein